MFQKELGEKIISKFPSKNYGRLSILTNYKLRIMEKLLFLRIVLFQDQRLTL